MMQYDLDKQRRQQMMNQAEKIRLADSSQANQANNRAFAHVYTTVMAEVGRQMVNVGQRLQERHEAEGSLQPETSRL
jgi:hypothetical protein